MRPASVGWADAGGGGGEDGGRSRRTEDGLAIYLNDLTWWCNVPVPLWEHMIGGY